jgi:tRNA uridine 5-carboxymethylaminomethyl modification enzyme
MVVQHGDEPMHKFSFLTQSIEREQTPCYLTYTNERTHEIIKNNLHRSAMYSGLVQATGTRYCPSIEDKIVRFADKEKHQIFIEPEGLTTNEKYVQGLSTSLPGDVQIEVLHSIQGLENAEVMRYGYAIEYDCIDPTELDITLASKRIEGLYFAGQMNGSSGYEEAAAQGILAGINAGLFLSQQESFILTRADAYIGVLVDDLATKGTQEPYRMMTSRAEYRLLLRQDNADLRLTEKARRTGLISDKRYDLLMRKREGIQKLTEVLNSVVPPSQVLNEFLAQKGYSPVVTGVKLYNLLKRENIGYTDILGIFPDLPAYEPEISEQVEITAKYEGYIKKQQEQVMSFNELERIAIPENIDYMSIHGLKIEARQKFSQVKPKNLGQASRISGVSPADIAVLLVKIKSLR